MGLENARDHHGLTTGLPEVGSVLRVARRGASIALSDDDRRALLADAVAGREVSLVLTAQTYIQRETPNRRFVRFTAGALQRLAPSFAGQPFLRNHDQGDQLARGGTIIASKLVDHPDGKAIEMEIELTAPWAVEAALRGLIDRFSIGWHRTGIMECSVCHKDMFDWRGSNPCTHWPGDLVELDGKKVRVEAVITGADGTEVSTVNVPAVVGTKVTDVRGLEAEHAAELLEIRSALSAARHPGARAQEKPMSKLASILITALGLAADTSDEALVAGVGALKAERDAHKDAAERAQRALAAAEQERDQLRATAFQVDLDALMADAKRKLGQKLGDDGKPVEGEVEKSLRSVAKELGVKAAREMLDRLPQIVPAARGDRREDVTPPAPKLAAVTELTAAEKKAAAMFGVSEEAFLATKNRLNGTAA